MLILRSGQTVVLRHSRSRAPGYWVSWILFRHFPSTPRNGVSSCPLLSPVDDVLLWQKILSAVPNLTDGTCQQRVGLLSGDENRCSALEVWGGGKLIPKGLALAIPSPTPGWDGDGQQHPSSLPLGCLVPVGPISITRGE